MPGEQAIKLTVKTVVGDYDVTLELETARAVLKRFGIQGDIDGLDAKTLASWLKTVWLSNAMKADSGVAGSMDSPYLNYQTDRGEMVSIRSTSIHAVEARLVPLVKGMGFGALATEPPELPPNVVKFPASS